LAHVHPHLIAQCDGLVDGAQLVKPIFTQRPNLQTEIDFGKGTDRGGHTPMTMITENIAFSGHSACSFFLKPRSVARGPYSHRRFAGSPFCDSLEGRDELTRRNTTITPCRLERSRNDRR